ncbi:Cell division protein FtsI/penicillin-binding protein 2 [Actinokineospora alba]|uniref:Cell division protein FtsI/penicillin-binding protein 2 n=1 Tax=Actinokineospora alba TaxID=504798 RepID=A0A1H0I8U9_9PSEU|nr:penicillin-binding transpeptidase domain-containing protein [Actinokineospora alba]TDP64553.1 cell division protein FtsI/penicillin-binding protein 2 [Actinokineospora alba]SDI87342.1 Cell division protein FtsI/penicillin-binding protein 2 [Actinokineospora alba]SDO27806.1 Cell division protein FtsI/penicillin-binding protein 2 [Actinokineospora alba]
MRVSLSRPAALLAALVAVLPLTACAFGSDPGPKDAANQFVAAFAGGDTVTASQHTDSAESAKALMDKVRGGIKPATVIAHVKDVVTTEGQPSAKATYEITWDLGRGRLWTYTSTFDLRTENDAWKVHWEPSVLHPKLAAQQTIAVRDIEASLAPVLDRDGTPVLQPERVISVLFDQGKAGDATAIAGQLAGALSGIDPTITQASILEGATKAGGKAYQVVALRDGDYQKVRSLIYELQGVRFTAESRLLPVDKALAPTLLPGIRKLVEQQVEGAAGWSVHTVDGAGADVEELFSKQAETATAVRVALSKQVQTAAQAAIAGEATPSMIVAIQPSTGDVLAVAQNAPADAAGQLALTGRYPPGSTFKIVTAAAALKSGKAAADTPLGCPGTKVIDGREIPNSGKFDKGVIPLRSAFAFSCNTTFAELAVAMAPDELTTMAKQLGLGVDYVVPGFTTITGSVPPATGKVERAEDGFGQGKVVASPFGMAVVAATVASGTVPKPVLVRGSETKSDTVADPVAAEVLGPVRDMMREVVTAGTAGALGPYGDVRGKTGTAQFGDGTHSHGWFVGYRGDLAFAVLLTDVGQSGTAVQAAARFLGAVA